jgi:histidine triad (HIT) family protein
MTAQRSADPRCLFCRIAAGSVPGELVYEDPATIAFLDVHPAARGHVLVVPRAHAGTLLDLEDDAVADLFRAVKAVQRRIDAALRPLGFNVGWNHGPAAGQVVPHLHVHVLPRYADGGRGIQLLGAGGDRGELASVAAAIRGAPRP